MPRVGLRPVIVVFVVWGLALAVPGRAQQDAFLGRWEGTSEGPQGKRPAAASFERDPARGITGAITGIRGELALEEISVAGDTLTAEARFETPRGSLRIKYTFVREGTELKGKSETDFGGQTFVTSFDLKRAATPPTGSGRETTPGPEASRRPTRDSVPQPTQKQSLDYFSGRWNFRWVTRESAVSPGGVVEGTMSLGPVPDSPELRATGVGPRRPEGDASPRHGPKVGFLEGRLEGASKTGPLGERLLLGFDEATRALVLLEQRGGMQTLSLGDWSSPLAIRFEIAPFLSGGHRIRLKRTLTVVAAHSFTVIEELSEDGGPFVRLGNAVFSRASEAAGSPAKN